jgi:hypothetical protein
VNDVQKQISTRIGNMQEAVYEAVKTAWTRELGLAITGNRVFQVTIGGLPFTVPGANCPPRDARAESDAIGRWVSQNRQLAGQIMTSLAGRKATPVGDAPATLCCSLLSVNGVTSRLRAAQTQQGVRIYALAGLPKNHPSSWSAVDVDLQPYRFGIEMPYSKIEDFPG